MKEEYFYGNGGFDRNDGNVTGKSDTSPYSTSEDKQINPGQEESHPEFNQSNRRFDNYFLNFSSWL